MSQTLDIAPTQVTPPTDRSGPQHFEFVDALRGIAILGVVSCHACFAVDDFHGRFHIYFTKGSFGVQLFFIVSAFTLFWSLRSRSKKERKPIHAFFVRRLFRIVPLFWVATFFYLWQPDIWRTVEAPAGVHWPQIATTLLLIHGWSASTISSIVPGGWSIAAEVMFYLCIPFFFSRIKTLSAALWLTVISLTAAGLILPGAFTAAEAHYPHAWADQAHAFVERSFPAQFPVFCMGFVLYFLLSMRGGKFIQPAASHKSIAWLFVILSACILLCDLPPFLTAGGAFLSLAYALAIHPLRPLVNRFTRYLGLVSYSIYIWHFFVLQHLAPFLLNRIRIPHLHGDNLGIAKFAILLVAALIAVLPIATASYYLIEVPGQQLGKWIIRKMQWDAPIAAA